MLAFGVRFDDRVTGKLELFARHATIVHIDIDAAEIGKNKARGGRGRGGAVWGEEASTRCPRLIAISPPPPPFPGSLSPT